MDDATNFTISNGIIQLLKDALTTTFKSYHLGAIEDVKAIYPFLAVGNMTFDRTAETIGRGGRDVKDINISVVIGTKSVATGPVSNTTNVKSGKAYEDINALGDSVENVLRVSTINNIFRSPINIRLAAMEPADDAGHTWLARYDITGQIPYKRNA